MIEVFAASVETTSTGFPIWAIALLGIGIGAVVLAFRRSRSSDNTD